jgi:DNA (cytosine-5)-methyltransferase 3A
MNVLSLFDGMSCGRIALERAGIMVDNYFSAEIKPYAIKVADINYPQDKANRLGDVTKVKGSYLPKIDLLIGGSPCQDFSGANKERNGHEGVKSRLFFEYVRILKEKSPLA